jgi:hypothetical protein
MLAPTLSVLIFNVGKCDYTVGSMSGQARILGDDRQSMEDVELGFGVVYKIGVDSKYEYFYR